MQKTVDFLSEQLIGFQTDNISMAMVEAAKFPYHGQPTPLRYLASASQQNRRISLKVFDRSVVDAIAKYLLDSGFEAYKFSKDTVVINIPLPTGEQRDKVVKKLKSLGEETKVALRNIRKKWKKQGIDEEELNKAIAKYNAKVDDLVG